MNAQMILTAKIDFLSGNSNEDLNEQMQAFIANDPQLQQEISFVEALWCTDLARDDKLAEVEQPTAALDARFYQMLSQAQSVQLDSGKAPARPSVWQQLQHWFTPKPIFQLALMASVFALGYAMNNFTTEPIQANEQVVQNSRLSDLQQQVQSLNTLVALSMIKDPSASTRLTAISYSRQASGFDQTLTSALIKTLNSDKSTAVRLAAVDALGQHDLTVEVENALLTSIVQQNPLVQIELIKLMTRRGSQTGIESLKVLAKAGKLNSETQLFWQQWPQLSTKQHSI